MVATFCLQTALSPPPVGSARLTVDGIHMRPCVALILSTRLLEMRINAPHHALYTATPQSLQTETLAWYVHVLDWTFRFFLQGVGLFCLYNFHHHRHHYLESIVLYVLQCVILYSASLPAVRLNGGGVLGLLL